MGTAQNLDLQQFYPSELEITDITESDNEIIIEMKSKTHTHRCPECGEEGRTYHGTYKRKVQDLPIIGKTVTLCITAYEYYCVGMNCTKTIFVEDYEGFIRTSGRMTTRLEELIQTLALETSCAGAAAICKKMGIRVSGDTIVRMLRRLADQPAPKCGDTVGVDDFAYKKGHTYCTVIVDEETRRPIEILDGRDGEKLSAWLKSNKQIKKVTRDRAGAYARAISEALPEAMQVADRFHLHQNLLNAIKEALRAELPTRIKIPNDLELEKDMKTDSEKPQVIEEEKK
jgi:transposase